jgi:hypothetical protein
MKFRSLAVAALPAVLACTASGLDEANRDGSADQKSLSRPIVQAPGFRGALGLKNSHSPRAAAVGNTAPANAHLTYYGGNIIETPTYTNIYWGAFWTSGAGLAERQHYNAFTQAVPTTPEFTSVVAEYTGPGGKTIHPGVYAGEKLISGEPGASIDDTQIKSTIQSWVNAGLVPAPSLDLVYVIYFPQGTSVKMGPDGSCTQFCGYHSTIQTTSGTGGLIRYVVMPHPDCAGCKFEPTVQDSVTVVASHEFWEAATDADVGLATSLGPPLAWYDQANGENGDICAGDPNATLLGYRVQTAWSNADNKCVSQRNLTPPAPDFSVSISPGSQTVTQGGSTSFTATATPANGFSGAIAWSVSGLPSGATGSFSSSGNSQSLSIAAGTSTAAGTYSFTVTGASGSLSHSATASLTVSTAAQADFSLALSPASVSIQAGASATAIATISGSNGFSSGVSLSASGLPSGVTAAFSPATVTGSGKSTLTLAVAAGAAAGTSTVTVSGTAGGLSHSADISLAITQAAVPDFSVAVAPGSVSLQAGASAHATLSVGASNGFADDVALSVSGAGSDLTVTFANSTVHGSGSTDVTVTAAGTAVTASSTLTFTGQSTSGSHSVTFAVSVAAAPPPGNGGVVFSDDAENGNIGWLFTSRNPRDPHWSIETSAASHSGAHRFRSNAGRNYANNTATFMISPAFSLAGMSSARLAFFYKFATEDYYDNFFVWASGDDGHHWSRIAEGTGLSQGWSGWAPQASLDLSRYAGKSKVRIAFSLQSDYSITDWGVAIDDISVTAQ